MDRPAQWERQSEKAREIEQMQLAVELCREGVRVHSKEVYEEEGEGGQWLKVLRGADCGVGGFFLAVSPAVSRREGIQVFKAECQRPVLSQHPAPPHRYSG